MQTNIQFEKCEKCIQKKKKKKAKLEWYSFKKKDGKCMLGFHNGWVQKQGNEVYDIISKLFIFIKGKI